MDVEIFTKNSWQKRTVDGVVVNGYLLVGGSVFSPKFWKYAGESWSTQFNPQFRKHNYFMGPFADDDKDLADELSARHNRPLKKVGGKWYIL